MMSFVGPALHWVVLALVLSIGLRTRLQDIAWVFRAPSRAGRAFASLFVLVPLFALAIGSGFGLPGSVALLLLMLSVAPLAPLFPNDTTKIGVASEAAIGLGAFAAFGALLMTPVMLWVVEHAVRVDIDLPAELVLSPLLKDLLLPILLGMVAAQLAPERASQASAIIVKIATPAMLVLILLLLWSTRELIVASLDLRVIAACALLAGSALIVGHLLGGPTPANRAGLAMAASGRNIGYAIAVAKAVLPAETAAIAGTAILYALIRSILLNGYTRLTQQVAGVPAGN